jgi:carbamoyltransferase
MIIVGINAFHGDSAACIVRDGVMLAAAEEERFRRVKHWAGFPTEAIRYCLEEAGVKLSDVDAVAINQDAKANLGKRVAFTLANRPDLGMVLDRIKNKRALGDGARSDQEQTRTRRSRGASGAGVP